LLLLGFYSAYLTISGGIGVWGLNNDVPWGFDITCFVFWVGVAHAGTLLSAAMYVFKQQWRSSLHRTAEAMTLVALCCAAFFPLIHTGRPWFAAYWLFPYPNQMGLLPNFNSPMLWDLFAIAIYFVVSVFFWFYGMLPDFLIIRTKIKAKSLRKLYTLLGAGWIGTPLQWQEYRRKYKLFAGIATALGVSVHTIVSFDFAVTLLPGWHSTIFPFYFVAGAIFSGCSLVTLILIFIRKLYSLENIILSEHIEKLTKITVTASIIISITYLIETFNAELFGNGADSILAIAFSGGRHSLTAAITLVCVSIVPLMLLYVKIAKSGLLLTIISILSLIGIWLERLVIIVPALENPLTGKSVFDYSPTLVEFGLLGGSIGLFIIVFYVFLRVFPAVAVYELKP